MLQLADSPWTVEALHRACLLARKSGSQLVAVKMLPVQHPGWLGTDMGNLGLSMQDYAELKSAALTAEDYGVHCATTIFQYVSLTAGLVEVAGVLNAGIVFATLPVSRIPGWTRWQMSRLRYGLLRQGRILVDRSHPGLFPAAD
jgi:hypothetical protein